MRELIDQRLLSVFSNLAFLSLIVGSLAVLLTEAVKISYNSALSKGTEAKSSLGWYINLIMVAAVAFAIVLFYVVEIDGNRPVRRFFVYLPVVVIVGWILSTLFYRIVLKVVFNGAEILILEVKSKKMEAKTSYVNAATELNKNRIELKETLKNELLVDAQRAIERLQ